MRRKGWLRRARILILLALILLSCQGRWRLPPVSLEPGETPHIVIGSFEHDGETRKFTLYLPKDTESDAGLPLVIFLHGYQRTAEQDIAYTHFDRLAQQESIFVVAPEGLPNWNSGISRSRYYPTPDTDDVGFIDTLLGVLAANYSVDLTRVYATGFCNGGTMAYRLACELGDRIAAIAPVSGPVVRAFPADCRPGRPVPVLAIFGTANPAIPFDGNTTWLPEEQVLTFWAENGECASAETTALPDADPTDRSTVERTTYTGCAEGGDVVFLKIIDGGLIWPGAGDPGFYARNANMDIDANVEIWRFFSAHRLAQP